MRSGSVVNIYALPVQDDYKTSYTTFTPRAPSEVLAIPPHPRATQSRPAIHRIYADCDIIAVTVVSFGAHVNVGDCPLEILLASTSSPSLLWVHPRFVQVRLNLIFRNRFHLMINCSRSPLYGCGCMAAI